MGRGEVGIMREAGSKKGRYTFTISPKIIKRAKSRVGPIPLSRWIEALIAGNLGQKKTGDGAIGNEGEILNEPAGSIEVIGAAILNVERELATVDQRRNFLYGKREELRHDLALIVDSRPEPKTPPALPKSALTNPGEKVGEVRVGERDWEIRKTALIEVIAAFTTGVPEGEWFKPSLIRPVISKFYRTEEKYVGYYLKFLSQNGFVEDNGKSAAGRRYRWFKRFKTTELTDEERQRKFEEDRRALQDVMG